MNNITINKLATVSLDTGGFCFLLNCQKKNGNDVEAIFGTSAAGKVFVFTELENIDVGKKLVEDKKGNVISFVNMANTITQEEYDAVKLVSLKEYSPMAFSYALAEDFLRNYTTPAAEAPV